MRIGILGGTGPAGTALAARLASVGYDVVIGSRSKERAEETRDTLVGAWPDLRLPIDAGDNPGAAACELVVVATPWDSAAATARSVAAELDGKVVVSMANALLRVDGEFEPLVPPRGSIAAHVQAAVPSCRVVAAFHHLPARELGHLADPVDSDVLMCSDDPDAMEVVSEIVRKIPGCRPLDAGSLSSASAIEAFTAVLLQLNVRYRTRVGAEADGHPVLVTVRLHDTRRGEVVAFEPGRLVTMYTCGITPYDATHLGHATVYTQYDLLQRRLRDLGHEVRCVRNITDVDDSILDKARALGVHYLDLAAGEVARFQDDMRALDVLPAFSEPRATSAIPDIRGFIGMVLDRGHAYQAGGGVYFDVTTFPGFGEVSHYSHERMLEYARERGGNVDDPNKRHPLDFVLWQPSAPDEPSWETMWGPGRPGWHIECSALALRELGTTIDLHGGGDDLIFPHHECERAQSEAATGEPFVRHWMHVAMVRKDGEKMSKSLGNLVFVDALRRRHDPRAIRLAIISHHYRDSWEWDAALMPRADERLDRWLGAAGPAGGSGKALDEVRAALDDDLDAPRAVAAIDDAVDRGEAVGEAAALLGVDLSPPLTIAP